jgi:arylsulfatase A-like enzyme
VVLITVSSLRADRVAGAATTRVLTPRLDEIARGGYFLARSRTPVPSTVPALTSLFTGLDPGRHRLYRPGAETPAWKPLPATLKAAGFTGVAGLSSARIAATEPLVEGLDEIVVVDGGTASEVATAAIGAADRHDPSDRLFLWAHFQDPSAPYLPTLSDLLEFAGDEWNSVWKFPLPVAEKETVPDTIPAGVLNGPAREVAFYLDSYDSAVREVDRGIGMIWDWLSARDLADDTLFVVASLHGEALGEHGYWFSHGWTLYEEELVVPLLIRAPGVLSVWDDMEESWASLLDAQPTILSLLGLPVGPRKSRDGIDLAPLLRGSSAPPQRYLYAGLANPPFPRAALGEFRFKMILVPPRPPSVTDQPDWPVARHREMYDLQNDALEARDLERPRRTIANELETWIQDTYPPWPGTPPAEDDSRRR